MPLMTEYERGKFDMFLLITSAIYGKQYYFLNDDGTVFSRACCDNLSFDEAYDEFMRWIGKDWQDI